MASNKHGSDSDERQTPDTALSDKPDSTSGVAAQSKDMGHALAAGGAAAWVNGLFRFDAWLTRIETKLLFFVLLSEIGALVVWIMLKGFAMPASESRGAILRSAFLAGFGAGLGVLLRFLYVRFAGAAAALEPGGHPSQPTAQSAGAGVATHAPSILAGVGLLMGYTAPGLGSAFAQNILNWLQNASVLFLIGGLRGLVTRLTLWLALLGASLATGRGKHINIDVVMRAVLPQFRVPLALIGATAAIVMSLTGAWGFVDQLAIGEFHAPRTEPCAEQKEKACEVAPGLKVAKIREEFGHDMFLLSKQVALDLRTLPVVLMGKPYDRWMTPADWNRFINEGNFAAHYPADGVSRLQLPADRTEPILPAVIVPGGEENAMGLLVRDLNLVVPMGLFMIALRFLLRAIFIVSGRVTVDPDAAHSDDDDEPATPVGAATGKGHV